MDRRRAARPGNRGGELIPSLRASRVRLAVAAVALLLGAALAGYPLAGADGARPAVAVLAGVSLVLLGLSVRWPRLIALLLICLAAELVARDLEAHVPPGVVAAYSAALLLVSELAAWAGTLRSGALVEPAVVARRVARLGALVVLGATASALTLAGSRISPPDAFIAGVAGAAAVAGLLAVVWTLGREAA